MSRATASTAWEPAEEELDVDESTWSRREAARQRQIMIGKARPEYRRYISEVQIEDRGPSQPTTPDPRARVSKRQFDRSLGEWRRRLHEFDVAPWPVEPAPVTENKVPHGVYGIGPSASPTAKIRERPPHRRFDAVEGGSYDDGRPSHRNRQRSGTSARAERAGSDTWKAPADEGRHSPGPEAEKENHSKQGSREEVAGVKEVPEVEPPQEVPPAEVVRLRLADQLLDVQGGCAAGMPLPTEGYQMNIACADPSCQWQWGYPSGAMTDDMMGMQWYPETPDKGMFMPPLAMCGYSESYEQFPMPDITPQKMNTLGFPQETPEKLPHPQSFMQEGWTPPKMAAPFDTAQDQFLPPPEVGSNMVVPEQGNIYAATESKGSNEGVKEIVESSLAAELWPLTPPRPRSRPCTPSRSSARDGTINTPSRPTPQSVAATPLAVRTCYVPETPSPEHSYGMNGLYGYKSAATQPPCPAWNEWNPNAFQHPFAMQMPLCPPLMMPTMPQDGQL